MSISDNEDLDKKPSAKKTTEDSPSSSSSTNNNSRRTQKRGLNNNWSSSDDNDEKAGIRGRGGRNANIVHKNLRLSYDDQVDISYRRTALLLRGGGGSGSGGEKKNEIIIMPSLVSLGDDFFNTNNIENDNYNDIMDSGEEMEESPEVVSSENNFDSSSNNSSNVAGMPRLRPRSLRDSEREQAGRALAAMFAENNNRNRNNESSGTSSSVGRPREDWPIGPQGAQVPSYLLYPRLEDDVMVNTGNSSNNNNNGSGGNEGVAARSGGEQQSTLGGQMSSSSTSTNSLLMMDTDTTTNTPNTPPRVAAAAAAAAQLPGRSNQDSPQRSAARRVREIMTRTHQSPSSSSLQHQQQTPTNQYINTAQSLEFALNRLEERLRQLDNNEKEHNSSNQNEDMVEAHMLTELAEIMLHPPTDVINGTYCWKGDDKSDNKNKGGDHEEGVTLSSTLLSATTATDDTNIVGNNRDACNKQDDDDETKDVMMMPEEDDDDGDDVSPRLPAITTTLLINQDTPRYYSTLQSAKQSITSIGKSCPTRRVCQHPFRRNDIVWVCRTCQSDETCVLCHDCFSNSDHEGHDVAFYHAQAGGCCDCGDADAWDPKGFCHKHGGNGQGLGLGPGGAKAEPAVLGSAHACADWLVEVVQSGVEGGYRRANPLPIRGINRSGMMARTDSALPESYEEPELARDRQRERSLRRERSLTRRNTVADIETTTAGGGAAEDDGSRTNSMRTSYSMMSIDANVSSEAPSSDFDDSSAHDGVGSSRLSTPILHEVQFDPAAASASRRRGDSISTSTSKREAESPIDGNIFDPMAASSSKSSLHHHRATKKARAPPKSPARALGDLGREGRGLFLVVHSDDIRVGAHSPIEASNALKEFFSKSVPAPTDTDNAAVASSLGDGIGGFGDNFFFSGAGPFPPRGVANDDGRPNNFRLIPRGPRFRFSNLDALVDKILRIIRKRGELIVWGTQELLAECGDVTARCWRDGDPNSSTLIGASMLNRVKILTDRGLVCSIKTRKEVVDEQNAASVIDLLNLVAQSCDPLCDHVSSGISGRGICATLPPMLRNDLKLPYKFVSSWHTLLLTLLAVPNFKASLANAYSDTYRAVTGEYARGVGLIERSSYTLSVQFLNRISYVTELVRERRLITNLFLCLYEILSLASIREVSSQADRDYDAIGASDLIAAALALLGHTSLVGADDESIFRVFDAELNDIMNRSGGDSRHHGRVSTRGLTREHHRSIIERSTLLNPKLDPTHNALAHRRYSVCISDLKCVLNVDGMARHFASLPRNGGDDAPCAVNAWIKTLSLAQNMDGQRWKDYSQAHIERENSAWVGAFNTSISLGSLYERLLKWDDADASPIDNFAASVQLMSCADLCYYTLTKGVDKWQRGEIISCRPSPAPSSMKVGHALKSASLPFSTVASAHGTPLAMASLPIAQLDPFSFHLPLHRFFAACVRELSRRSDGNGGLLELIGKFQINPNASEEEKEKQHRKNDLLFRGIMEFPIVVLSRAAQIRAGIWRRNGPGMSDMVLNYSEPPFCRNLQDADIFLVQLALVCIATLNAGEGDNGAGTARLVNMLIHRFGVFSFLGFEMAPPTDLDRYVEEIRSGMYPAEIKSGDNKSSSPAMTWVYTPARDSSHEMLLLGEMLHLLITLISELPPPPAENESQHAIEARRRLIREVIHRLASGSKTHSEMTEVHHILSNRDTDALCELGKKINPDDASGAALEEVLNEVGTRKCRSGAPDEWELKESAWSEYDPSFPHISTRSHQHASERRPKQKADSPCVPYAPRPLPAHNLFSRLRRDFTSDAALLACVYRVIHVHCYECPPQSMTVQNYPGIGMYEADKSETVLGRAIHLLTLGVYAWEEEDLLNDNSDWRIQGGGGIGSVFETFDHAPTTEDWVEMVFLRAPNKIMQSEEYTDEQSLLFLLCEVAMEKTSREQDASGFLGGLDQSLKSGAMFLCNFAAKVNSEASSIVTKYFKKSEAAKGGADDLEKRKMAAKEKALAAMKAQMAKFAANLGGDDEDDHMSDAEGTTSPNRNDDARILATPVRQRTDSTGLEAMDLSPHGGDFILTQPSTPFTPLSPQTPMSPRVDGKSESPRLFAELPRCIICGDDDKIDCDNILDASPSPSLLQKQKRTLAFCGFSQASTVLKGGSRDAGQERHVGVHTTLCGHAIHNSCCETYFRTSQRDRDRLDGGKRKEFRCPLCQRLSNCLVPFVDVAADWLDCPSMNLIADDGLSCKDSNKSLGNFLSNSTWWATRNDGFVWDGHCKFATARETEEKKVPSSASILNTNASPSKRKPLKKIASGKRELINAWNQVLRTPRRLQRRTLPSAFVLAPPGGLSGQKESNSTDILRKFMDQIVDVGLKADLKRLGDAELKKDYGEFRHYVTEKTFYGNVHRVARKGREWQEWPKCLISSTLLSKEKLEELSKEKLISKLLYSIQAFTYSCCSEACDVRRLLRMEMTDKSSIYSKFGLGRASLQNNLLLLPRADATLDGGFQPFDGRMGKIRYMGLALMAAAGPVSKEIVQLCMPFPFSTPSPHPDAIFDFDAEDDIKTARAPVAYPLLNSHVLTHTTCALIAVTGSARADDGISNIDDIVDECRKFISLGLVARVLQVVLAGLTSWKGEKIRLLVETMCQEMMDDADRGANRWRKSCFDLLRIIFDHEGKEEALFNEDDDDAKRAGSQILNGVTAAKEAAVSYLSDIIVIVQILIPNIFADDACLDDKISGGSQSELETIESLMKILQLESIHDMIQSELLHKLVKSWYKEATEKKDSQLEYARDINGMALTWPIVSSSQWNGAPNEFPPNCSPLLGYSTNASPMSAPSCGITCLPKSYTDLYAQLSTLCPDSDQIGLCLVCGTVLDAGGKGQCTKHASKCGAGVGVFFLVQECVALCMHGKFAAYHPSPYVDSHGETPQYRGRPLNLDVQRWKLLQDIYMSHSVREKVISERSSSRQVIIANYY